MELKLTAKLIPDTVSRHFPTPYRKSMDWARENLVPRNLIRLAIYAAIPRESKPR
jgi:hypothetical protein